MRLLRGVYTERSECARNDIKGMFYVAYYFFIFLSFFGIIFLMSRKLKIVAFLGLILIFGVFNFSQAASLERSFNIQADYDYFLRNEIETQLIKTTNQIYFYADKDWWNNSIAKNQVDSIIYNLGNEFEYKIYPTLTNAFGKEDFPGIDNDPRIIIALHKMKPAIGGYIQTEDSYSSKIYPRSNEGQIIYLAADNILSLPSNILNYHLAHEFMHLITLKQKPNADTWFYELISEFGGQAIGVDTTQITKQRAQNLLYSTEINLKDWKNLDKDYGKVYLLGLYLKEQFGEKLFVEALKYPSSDGLISFNEALKKYQTNFDEVYLNWLITNLYNTCETNNLKYCYQNEALKNYSTIAYSYYLPIQSKSSLSVTDSISTWTGKWQKITGGQGTIKLKFSIPEQTPISKIPYIIEDNQGKKTLGFLDFSATNIQEIYVNDMGSKNAAVYFIPFIGSLAQENKLYYYSWEAQNLGNDSQTEKQLIEKLTQQIEELKRKIVQLQLQLAFQKTNQSNQNCSFVFGQDLYYGMTSSEIKCLQQFLANLGPEIYPEKLITGYYGPLTMAAVKRYQTLKGIISTGYFGPLTRAAVKQGI